MSTLADDEFSEATTLILNSIDHVNLTDGNIITQYHPSAILDPQIVPLKEYLASSTSKPASVFDSCPWHPFSSQLDFDLAEFILRMGMNHQAWNDFFSIIDRCGGNQSTEYTIQNENDLAEAWSHAENWFTKVDFYLFFILILKCYYAFNSLKRKQYRFHIKRNFGIMMSTIGHYGIGHWTC